MKNPSKLVLLIMTLSIVLMFGCDNGSVSGPAAEKSSGLVKVCLTVDGDSGMAQRSVSADGTDWASFTYKYCAIPQWSSDNIHGETSWKTLSYSEGMSLGYFTPGRWVFGIQILSEGVPVYEGYSDVISISTSQVSVTVAVAKIIQDAAPGRVSVRVYAPAVDGEELTVAWNGTAAATGETVNGSGVATATPSGGLTLFTYTTNALPVGNYIFTLNHNAGSGATEKVVLLQNQVAVISGNLENGEWRLGLLVIDVYSINFYKWNHQTEAWGTGQSADYHGEIYATISSAAPGDRVAFTARPEEDSNIDSVEVMCGNTQIPCTRIDENENLYTFIMPDGDVSVKASFITESNIDPERFMYYLHSVYTANMDDVQHFGRSNTPPAVNGIKQIGNMKIWYDKNQHKVSWYSPSAKPKFKRGSLANLFRARDKYISISMEGLDTSAVTDMAHMFDGCLALQSVDLTGIDTGKVTDMSYMFYKAGYNGINKASRGQFVENNFYLQVTGLNSFNTSSVTNMSHMFNVCSAKTLAVSGFDVSHVTDFSHMFAGEYTGNYANFWYTKFTSLDVSSWKVGGDVANNAQIHLEHMFDMVQKLTSLALTDDADDENAGWKFTKVVNMASMFNRCEDVTSIVFPKYTDLKNVTSLTSIFCRDAKIKVGSGNGDGGFKDIFSRWDISNNNIIEFSATPSDIQSNGDSANRLVQDDSTGLKNLSTTRFSTYNGYVEIGSTNGSFGVTQQRLKKVTQ